MSNYTSMREAKDKFRKKIIDIRNNLSFDFVKSNSNIIIEKISKYIENSNNIMIFMDMNNEVAISKLVEIFPFKNFYIPKTINSFEMKINKYNKNELVLHNFGFYESNSNIFFNENILDLIIIPGVAFDINKNRIGFGAGYYDRFLHKFKKNHNKPLFIAVCYDFQIFDSIPFEEHDTKMDLIITESRIL